MHFPYHYLLLLLFFTQSLFAAGYINQGMCPDKAEITAPIANKVYPNGSDLNIIVKSTQCALINNAVLYFNGHLISKKHGPNASWSHSHFKFLRKMAAGKYHVRIRIQEYNGQTYELELNFRIAGMSIELAKDHDNHCVFINPVKNLTWLRHLKQKNTNIQIQEYRENFAGRHRAVFAIRSCGRNYIAWYDCRGRIISRTSHSKNLKGYRFYKTWHLGCRS